MGIVTRLYRKFTCAFSGLRYAALRDPGFRLQCVTGAVAITLILALMWPFSGTEILFLCLAVTLVLITELQNSALEHLVDHLHPEHHEVVGRVKDMAAAAVLLAGLFAGAVLLVILLERISATA